jgi:regulator of protease activity HflC (stomatin/prohibitin superfamily)
MGNLSPIRIVPQ